MIFVISWQNLIKVPSIEQKNHFCNSHLLPSFYCCFLWTNFLLFQHGRRLGTLSFGFDKSFKFFTNMESKILHQETQYIRNNWIVAIALIALSFYWGVKAVAMLKGDINIRYDFLVIMPLILLMMLSIKQKITFSTDGILLVFSILWVFNFKKEFLKPDLATLQFKKMNHYLTGLGIRLLGSKSTGYIIEGKQGLTIIRKSQPQKKIYISLKASRAEIERLISIIFAP